MEKTEALLKQLGRLAHGEGVAVYAVGGYVRDRLMGRESSEIDISVVGDGVAFAEKAKKRLRGRGWVVYDKFGTAAFFKGEIRCEFVTARRESYRSDSRKPDVVPADLTADLSRRDFTVNALAMDLAPERFGALIDPFEGQKDIERRLIRTPGDPLIPFSEDPLRILRAARFASQLEFQVHPDVLRAMEAERERLRIVSQERITAELLKVLSHPKPSIGFRILQKTRVLEIVFPELDQLVGVEQRDVYHHKDVFDHTMKVLDRIAEASPDLRLRFAALVHDIGKPLVKRFVEGIGWTFHGHELVGVKMIRHLVGRMRLPSDFAKYAADLARLHMRPIQLIAEEVTDSAIRRLLVEAGDRIDDLMTLCRADITSGNPRRVKTHLEHFNAIERRMKEVEEKDRMKAFQSPVRGDEIMKTLGIGPGPLVGKIKKQIEEAILEGKIPNDHDAAFAYLLQIRDDFLLPPVDAS